VDNIAATFWFFYNLAVMEERQNQANKLIFHWFFLSELIIFIHFFLICSWHAYSQQSMLEAWQLSRCLGCKRRVKTLLTLWMSPVAWALGSILLWLLLVHSGACSHPFFVDLSVIVLPRTFELGSLYLTWM